MLQLLQLITNRTQDNSFVEVLYSRDVQHGVYKSSDIPQACCSCIIVEPQTALQVKVLVVGSVIACRCEVHLAALVRGIGQLYPSSHEPETTSSTLGSWSSRSIVAAFIDIC